MNTEIQHDGTTELRDVVLSQHDEWVCFASLKVQLPICRGVLVWDKGPASGMGDLTFPWKTSYELICINGKGWIGSSDEGVIKNHWIVTRASMGRTHPNEKPESLIAYLLSKHPAITILDPFMGSGTTLRAAKDLGRKCIGIEIEEKYCAIAVQRLRQEVLPL
jgi:adenine specific DNA methylase Mod